MKTLAVLISGLLAAMPTTASGQALSHAVVEDQFGAERNFSRDVIGDRVVVIGFTWTGCTTVCPSTDALMARTQQLLAGKLGPIRLVTITLDPLRDSPRRMAARANEFAAGPDWLWISGRFNAVRQVLGGLDAIAPDLDAHPPRFLIVDGRTRQFIERSGAPSPEDLSRTALGLLARRGR